MISHVLEWIEGNSWFPAVLQYATFFSFLFLSRSIQRFDQSAFFRSQHDREKPDHYTPMECDRSRNDIASANRINRMKETFCTIFLPSVGRC